jgi:SAM-dependent methyltransferase
MDEVFTATVLDKYKVKYYYCSETGLLRTEDPFWLEEAYNEAIGDADSGLLARNFGFSNLLEIVLEVLSLAKGKVLDVGGGYGVLTRLMRDKGIECYTTDKYCENLFARTFEPEGDFKADVLCAFEVLEHVTNPLEFLQTLFELYKCKTLIFSTMTFTGVIPKKDWWYYSFKGGQHISFYQPRTLSLLAQKLGCNYHMITPGFHVITDIQVPCISRLVLSSRYLRKAYLIVAQFKRRISKPQNGVVNC